MRYDHLDIFSGIGGFAIAAREAGFKTVAFCESDERCRTFLQSTWGLPVEPDIRELDGTLYRDIYGGISLLTGGPPCQPASRAGKQGGEGDDRWLWPEALRVLDESQPDCVVFENPPGILDVGIDGILSEMGRSGYEVQCFDIPACAVDSPQLRHRIWIVGFKVASANGQRYETESQPNCQAEQNPADRNPRRSNPDRCDEHMADTAEPGRERRDAERAPNGCRPQRPQSLMADIEGVGRREAERRAPGNTGHDAGTTASNWQNAIWVPCADGKLRRAPDDSFDLVDGLHRSLLGALGNSICPQVAVQILKAIRGIL